MKGNWILLAVLALPVALLVLLIDVVAAGGSGYLTRLTTASDSDRRSWYPSLSADGTIVAFQSDSDFLGQGIIREQEEIWLYDTATMTYTRVTTASYSDRDSEYPSLSADGTIVAFQSDSDLLGQGIPDDQYEIWLYDTATMNYTRVTTASLPWGRRGHSMRPSLSADGAVVAFHSDFDFLQDIPNTQDEIWLYDTETRTYTRVTTASDSDRRSYNASLSADGTVVAFSSDSDLLGQGIPNDQAEIWLYDTETRTYTRVTTASDSDRRSYNASLSRHETVVAFDSDSDLLGQGIPRGQYQGRTYVTPAMTYTLSLPLVTRNHPPVGTVIAFQSDSDFLGQGIPHVQSGQWEIWLYDTATMTYTRVTTASGYWRDSWYPSLSADGTVVAFFSDSDLLGQGIPNTQDEIWLYETATRTHTRVTTASVSNRASAFPSLSADGTVIAFLSDSDFLGQGIPNMQFEIWLYRPFEH